MIAGPSTPAHVVGMLGTTLDSGGQARWTRWRPTVSLCQQSDLVVGHFDLLFTRQHRELAEQVVADLAAVSPETQVDLWPVSLDDPWDFEEVYESLHTLSESLDMGRHPDGPLIHITTGTHVVQICWFLLAEARVLPGRLIQTSPERRSRLGGGRWSIIDLDLSRYDRIARRFERRREEGLSVLQGGIPTHNTAFSALLTQVEQVAATSREPVLLLGPTGAGKTRLARQIWHLKQARQRLVGELVEVDCATLRGDQAMSTLFGHVRGAFTGAETDRQGLLRRADGGLLFLDEIGELGLDEQAMLLRALEDRRFLPLGADTPVESAFQLIAGTRVDLWEAVRQGTFRQDLLARIDLWTFSLPGLRDRIDDLPPNLEVELERIWSETGRRVSMNHEARTRFLADTADGRWSGNFRDLRAAVTRMATLAPAGRIDVAGVEDELVRLRRRWGQVGDVVDEVLGAVELDPFDRVQLAEVIRVCRRSASMAAAGRTLFAVSRRKRTTSNDGDRLRKYLARFELDWAAVRQR